MGYHPTPDVVTALVFLVRCPIEFALLLQWGAVRRPTLLGRLTALVCPIQGPNRNLVTSVGNVPIDGKVESRDRHLSGILLQHLLCLRVP